MVASGSGTDWGPYIAAGGSAAYMQEFEAQWAITPPSQRGGLSPEEQRRARAAIAGQGAAALAAGWVMPVPEPGTIMGIKIPDTSTPWAEPGTISIGRRIDDPIFTRSTMPLRAIDVDYTRSTMPLRTLDVDYKRSNMPYERETISSPVTSETYSLPGQDVLLALVLLFL